MDLFLSSKFKAHVQELMKQHHVPGLALAIVHNDDAASEGFGQSSMEPPSPCTADTLFDIASCSKGFTAACVGLLVEDEQYPELKWDSAVSKLLPGDFVMPDQRYTDQVTVEDIVSHRSGMGCHDLSYMGPNAEKPDDIKSITRNLRNLSISAPIRTAHIYNNMMFSVAAYLVEQQTGVQFGTFLAEKIFAPLEMSSTHLHASPARNAGLDGRIATGYSWVQRENDYRTIPCRDIPEAIGAGNIISSVNDDIKWIRAMMDRHSPISKDIYDGVVKGRTLCNPSAEDLYPFHSPAVYAAGWEVLYYRGYQIVMHGGAECGFSSHHFFFPTLRFGGSMIGNSYGAAIVAEVVSRELIDEVLGVPECDRVDWNSLETAPSPDADGITKPRDPRRRVYPDIDSFGEQELPLGSYIGVYHNDGYHEIVVKVENEELQIDSTDRGMGFTLHFQHASQQTKYVAKMVDMWDGGQDFLRAEFVFDGDKAQRLGLDFEDSSEDLIWFDRVK